jgi:RNA polymerase sigma-70 factor (ECF subfamily)
MAEGLARHTAALEVAASRVASTSGTASTSRDAVTENRAKLEESEGGEEALRCDALEYARVVRAGEGDAQSQAWLVRRVISRVRHHARVLAGNAADADDAVQLAMLEILASARSFRGQSSIDHWVRRIAGRTIVRHCRKEWSRWAGRESDLPDEGPVVEQIADPRLNQNGNSEGLPRDVSQYIDELPAPQREAMLLHHALGYSLPEIAAMTDVSPNTVKGRLRLATHALRKRVRQDLFIGTCGRESGT